MNADHYREAANALDRQAETLKIRADKLDVKAAAAEEKARKTAAKAKRLDSAANDLRSMAKQRNSLADDYRKVVLSSLRLAGACLGCSLGYVPEGATYDEIHSCGQTIGAINTATPTQQEEGTP